MSYFKRLKNHPGLPMVCMFTVLFILAGLSNESFQVWWHGALLGLIVSVIFWLPVLISNIERRD